MTIWVPRVADVTGPLYRRVAKALEEDISGGRLPAGARLPTHRELARALATTVVTASRAYREAAQWGLIQGEVGRGTFVLAPPSAPVEGAGEGRAEAELGRAPGAGPGRDTAPVDLTENYIAAGYEIAQAARGAGADLLWESLRVRVPPAGTRAQRAAGAAWMSTGSFAPDPEQIVITAGAQHAIAAALGALGRPGDLLYVEALTYPGVKAAAHHLGLRLQPVPLDALGMVPEALADLCARNARGTGILYCQPSLHNPTGIVMPEERRREIAAIARRFDLAIVEDNPYGFLLDDPPPPLAALAPERTCHVVTCSKALAMGLRVGYVTAPEPLAPQLQAAAAATCLGVAMVELASRWIADGTARRIVAAKQREAELRSRLAGQILAGARSCAPPAGLPAGAGPAGATGAAGAAGAAGVPLACHPRGSHLWIELPSPWRVGPFVEQAWRRGVGLNPSEPFVAAHDAAAPNAVRVCLGPVADRAHLERSLRLLAELLASPPTPEAPVV